MRRLVKFPLADGSFIAVEVDEPDTGGTVRVSGATDVVAQANQTFEQALDKIRSATESAVNKLRDLSQHPNEIEMEFGFNLSIEFGAVIAKATAEANYKVTLHWTSENGQSKS